MEMFSHKGLADSLFHYILDFLDNSSIFTLRLVSASTKRQLEESPLFASLPEETGKVWGECGKGAIVQEWGGRWCDFRYAVITEIVTSRDGSRKILALKVIYPNLRVDAKRNIHCSTDCLNPTHPYNLLSKYSSEGDWEKAVRKVAKIKPPTVASDYKYRVNTFVAGKDFGTSNDWGLLFMKSIEDVIEGNEWLYESETDRCQVCRVTFPLTLCNKCEEVAYCSARCQRADYEHNSVCG